MMANGYVRLAFEIEDRMIMVSENPQVNKTASLTKLLIDKWTCFYYSYIVRWQPFYSPGKLIIHTHYLKHNHHFLKT